MAATATRDYQRAQAALRALTYREVQRLWPLLDLNRLDATFPRLAAALMLLVRDRRPASTALALSYLNTIRADAGITAALPLVEAPPLPVPVLLQRLRSSSVISVKSAMIRKTSLDMAARKALVSTMGAVDKSVSDAARGLIREFAIADPHARGWQRVTSGGCDFCERLASGGVVHTQATADFPSHDHCGCTPEPVYE